MFRLVFWKTVSGETRSFLDSWCSTCKAKSVKAWRKKYPKRAQQKDFTQKLKKYGLSLEQYNKMLSAQNGVCASCFEPPQEGKRLDIDHDHSTHQVRGLLCGPCNRALGHVRDSIQRLRGLIEYLSYPLRKVA